MTTSEMFALFLVAVCLGILAGLYGSFRMDGYPPRWAIRKVLETLGLVGRK